MTDDLYIKESCTYEDLKKLLTDREDSNLDLKKIEKAYNLANKAHNGQYRKSGKAYISHPLAVACMLTHWGLDTDSIVTALLHDVVEDTSISLEEIREGFGDTVALLTDGVTKLGKIPYSTHEEQQAENIRKMFIAMSRDIRVIIIKLADRLHNMHTLNYLGSQKQRDKALETMEVYAPIAHRLGIGAIKDDLEDISLQYLDPDGYKEIKKELEKRISGRQNFIEDIIGEITNKITGKINNFKVYGRIKSVYGVYRKVFGQGRAMDEIYDIYAFRVIVDNINDCYNVLGLMHDMYTPIPNRFKDFISMPKPNLYQSLHTTVISKKATPFEIQIRTYEMHRTAEYGIAAHWKYKLGISKNDSFEKRVAWIRQMIENQKDTNDVSDVLQNIKTDLMPEDVFVFTPKGEVKSLPLGSTIIDFAYSIHTDVGNRMIGAKVNGRITPIEYKIKTGDVINILTTKEVDKGPSRDWLNIVKTSMARAKIRNWFKKEKRDENIETGKAELEREFKRNNIFLSEDELNDFLQDIAKRQHCNSLDDLYAAIGYGGIQLWKIFPRIKDQYLKQKEENNKKISNIEIDQQTPKNKTKNCIIVDGLDSCLIKFSKCCNPLPGDDIIGYITRGHGVSVHKLGCKNVPIDPINSLEPDRWIKVSWNESKKEDFISKLEILVNDRENLLADITIKLSSMHLFITYMNSRPIKDHKGLINLTLKVKDKNHVDQIIANLEKIDGIIYIKRV